MWLLTVFSAQLMTLEIPFFSGIFYFLSHFTVKPVQHETFFSYDTIWDFQAHKSGFVGIIVSRWRIVQIPATQECLLLRLNYFPSSIFITFYCHPWKHSSSWSLHATVRHFLQAWGNWLWNYSIKLGKNSLVAAIRAAWLANGIQVVWGNMCRMGDGGKGGWMDESCYQAWIISATHHHSC